MANKYQVRLTVGKSLNIGRVVFQHGVWTSVSRGVFKRLSRRREFECIHRVVVGRSKPEVEKIDVDDDEPEAEPSVEVKRTEPEAEKLEPLEPEAKMGRWLEDDLRNKKNAELLELCAEFGVEVGARANKDQLVAALLAFDVAHPEGGE